LILPYREEESMSAQPDHPRLTLLKERLARLKEHIAALPALPPAARHWQALNAAWSEIASDPTWNETGTQQSVAELKELAEFAIPIVEERIRAEENENPDAKTLHLRLLTSQVWTSSVSGESEETAQCSLSALSLTRDYLAAHPGHAGLQKQVLSLYVNAGTAESQRGDPEAVLGYCRQGLALAPACLAVHPDHAGLQEQVLHLYVNAGTAEGQRGNLEAALGYYRQGLAVAPDFLTAHPDHTGLQEMVLCLYFNAGVTESQRGDLEAELAYYRQGLGLAQAYLAVHPDHASLQEMVLRLYFNAGTTEGQYGDLEAALGYCRQGLGLAQAYLAVHPDHASLQEMVLRLYVNAGTAESQRGNLEAALGYYRQGLAVAPDFLTAHPDHTGLQEQVLSLYFNAGVTESQRGNLEAALKLYQSGITQAARFFRSSLHLSWIDILFNLLDNSVVAKNSSTAHWKALFLRCSLTGLPQVPAELPAGEYPQWMWPFTALCGPYSYRLHQDALAAVFQQHLRDWLLQWRPADDPIGLNGNLLDACRTVELLYLLDCAETNQALASLSDAYATAAAPLQARLDAWRAGFERRETPLRRRLTRIAKQLGLASLDGMESLAETLAQRQSRLQRLYDFRAHRLLRQWRAVQRQYGVVPRLTGDDVQRLGRAWRAAARSLAAELLRLLEGPKELSGENEFLLAQVAAALPPGAALSPAYWREPEALHRLMAATGWEQWRLDDGQRSTLDGWTSPQGHTRPSLDFNLANSRGDKLDRWLGRYAGDLKAYLDSHSDFAATLPPAYVQAVIREAAAASIEPAATPGVQMGGDSDTPLLADILEDAWLAAAQHAEAAARLFAAIERDGEFDRPAILVPGQTALAPDDPIYPFYLDALHAVVKGRLPRWWEQRLDAWLTNSRPMPAEATVAEALAALKAQFARASALFANVAGDAQLGLRLHHYCRQYLAELARAPQIDLNAVWETLERGRLALTGLQMQPLPESAYEKIGKRLYLELEHELGQYSDKEWFTRLLRAWCDEIVASGFVPKRSTPAECRQKLQPDEAVVQLFFDRNDGSLQALWLDHEGLRLLPFADPRLDYRNFAAPATPEAKSDAPFLHAWRQWRQHEGCYAPDLDDFDKLWQRLENQESKTHAFRPLDEAPPWHLLHHLIAWAKDAGISRIVLLTEGPLAQLPLEAWLRRWFPDAGLVLERAVSLTHWRRTEKAAPTSGAVVVGDDAAAPIVHGAAEAVQAAAYFQNTLKLTPVRRHDGAATPFDVLARFRDSDAVHLVLHGHYYASDPRRSGITLQRTDRYEVFLHCRTLAAIAQRSRLVVFSACDSAVCGATDDDLLASVGIGQTLIGAGARRVLGSLWPVNQDASLLFHRFLYAAAAEHRVVRRPSEMSWNDLIAQAQARLRELTVTEAQQHLPDLNPSDFKSAPDDNPFVPDKPFRHPYYWMPFVLLGDQTVD
jgi:tetratricopeptide (TPR) repeat protein